MKKNKIVISILIIFMLFSQMAFAQAKVVNRGNPDIKEMALTFDDGYSVDKIRAITKVLNKHNVKGTFFFVGSFIGNYKFIVKELEEDGHLVVGHSFSHPDFTKLTEKNMIGQMENTKIAYTKATDKKIKPYFRPPYGAYDDRVLKTIGKNHDLYVVMWTIDTLDWKKTPAKTIAKRVLDNAGNGKIVLMHTTKHVYTDKALDEMITGLHAKGYKLVTIDEMMAKLPEKEQIPSITQQYLSEKEESAQTETESKKKIEINKEKEIENKKEVTIGRFNSANLNKKTTIGKYILQSLK